MNEGRTFFDLPQAQTVPAGSRYAVEMGDGTGTKSVTHEDLVKAVGGDLPLGDAHDLETDVKTDFVSAINEIKRKADASSGGATIQVKTSDPGLYGRTVTVSDGENTVTGVMSYGGECVIAGVLLTGDLTVSASTEEGVEDETTINVSLYATYYTNLDTRQGYNHLNVSTNDASLIGRVVTISNGTDTMTAIISQDGRARLVFTFSGTVNITASDATGNTANASINIISGVTTYDVHLQLGNMVSDAFSEEKSYAAGDYAIHNNVLYKFLAAKAAGAWDASKVQAVTVAKELCELNGKMSIRSLLFRENIPPNTEYVYDDNVSLGSILLLGGTWNHKEMYVLYISYIEEGWRNLIVNRIASYNSYSTFEFRITDAGKLAIKNIMEVTQPTLAYMIDSP
ncbi:MAG: hypothetical protein HFI92_06375 [Lachnospiraceae bacterium]|nr:hypothetical protein [Lachnospiraceae bacterium]